MSTDTSTQQEHPETFWLSGDRAPVPEAQETDSDAAWAEFERLYQQAALAEDAPPHEQTHQRGLEAAVEEAEQQGMAFAPTQPMEIGVRARPPGSLLRPLPAGRLSTHEAMVEARRFNRVCPKPEAWARLYEMIPNKVTTGRAWQPPPPVTGAAWAMTSAMPKRMCLRDQLEWAEAHGALEEVMAYLQALPEDQWHHVDEE